MPDAIAYGTSVQPFGHENRVASRREADRILRAVPLAGRMKFCLQS
ncbi:MAG TPA: hypothetical protein V6C85_17940 [Allocoleopsis sp.]